MTSNEILDKAHVAGIAASIPGGTVHDVYVREIAYQLAKLNEHFEKVDSAVFGGTNESDKIKKTDA